MFDRINSRTSKLQSPKEKIVTLYKQIRFSAHMFVIEILCTADTNLNFCIMRHVFGVNSNFLFILSIVMCVHRKDNKVVV